MEQLCDLTQERLKEVLDYNPETGIFMWIEPKKGRRIGDEAGSPATGGYRRITIDYRSYRAHRLAILYTDGYLPENTVDHIDRIPWHNWRDNLREASYQCQVRNCKMPKNNTSGIKGVSWREKPKKWLASIKVNCRWHHLGEYDSILGAAFARFAAEQCLGFQDCDLNSSAKQYIDTHGGK